MRVARVFTVACLLALGACRSSGSGSNTAREPVTGTGGDKASAASSAGGNTTGASPSVVPPASTLEADPGAQLGAYTPLPPPKPSDERKLTPLGSIGGNISPKSVVTSGRGLFFAQNMIYRHTVTVYDQHHKLIATIPDTVDLAQYGLASTHAKWKGGPVEGAFTSDGRYLYVSNYEMTGPGYNNPGNDDCGPSKWDESFVYRIDTTTFAIDQVIAVGAVPKFLAVSPDDKMLLVSNWCSYDVSVVDTASAKEIKRVKIGRFPRGIVFDPNRPLAYIGVMGSNGVSVLHLDDWTIDRIEGIGPAPRHLLIDRAGQWLYVSVNEGNAIAKVDLSTNKVAMRAHVGDAPRSSVLSPDESVMYVVNYEADTVTKLRTSDLSVLQVVKTGHHPIGITYDPQTDQIWVAIYTGAIQIFQDA